MRKELIMLTKRTNQIGCTLIVLLLAGASTLADDFDLSWWTIDGGGGYSAGGDFELEGTIGQHDAGPSTGPMTGGDFELVGGFWPVANVCACLGDMNGDGFKDGLDIQEFTGCVINGGSCACADVDALNGVTLDDVTAFVDALLAGNDCP